MKLRWGGILGSNLQSSPVNESYVDSVCSNVNEAESNTEKFQKYIKVDEYTKSWIKNVEETRSKVNALSQEEVIKELVNLLNNQNPETENKTFDIINNMIYFANAKNALYSKYLLKSAINYQKTNNIQATADHAKLFTRAMRLLSDEEKSKLSLLMFQMITNCEEQGNNIEPKDEIPVSFDSLNVDQLFRASAKNYPLEKAILNKYMSNEFLLAFIYKYLETAQVNPALAQEQLQVILDKEETPVTKLVHLLGQLHESNVNWEKYYEEVFQNKITTLSDTSEEKKKELLYKYSVEGMAKNSKEVIEEFNTARDQAIKYKLPEALPHIILTITEILKNKIEMKK